MCKMYFGSKPNFELKILIKRGRRVKNVRNEFKLSLISKVLMKIGEMGQICAE